MTGKIGHALSALRRSKFRSRFHLWEKEAAYVRDRGLTVIREHAAGFIAERLAPANPDNDGRQTPMKNHPVFIAQHATATCCRGCLAKWHAIPKGHELTAEQQAYVIDLIMTWIKHDMTANGSKEGT